MGETTHDPYPAREEVFYGRGVWTMGEEGDLGVIVEGHGRRAFAALNAQQRRLLGPDWRRREAIRFDIAEKWVVISETCGCTAEQHAADHQDEDGDLDCDCEFWGLPPCMQEVYSWACKWVPESTPGAVAVTEVAW